MSRFNVASELEYTATQPVTFLLNIRAGECERQRVEQERFVITGGIPFETQVCASTGNRFDLITLEVPGIYQIRYEATVEVSVERLDGRVLPETDPGHFDLELLNYLYPSRYCQSDRLGDLTASEFDGAATPYEKVLAVCDWIRNHVSYTSGSTHASTSAVDTLVERAGVCRDFAHLGIALCRAMNIPSRYFTGYAYELEPPDFHACFETWIGGHWLVWDATGLASPDGMVRIGTGRDAADVSISTSFGPLQLNHQKVSCLAVDDLYQKMSPSEIREQAISLTSAEPGRGPRSVAA
ncbi:transglutaminase family protein [Verrucomicrobium sp. BvORR106]|uniref:transglutaminase-like domain-containing protein n=1 Tax=Verrucomicrobium sp. BvORR106 TaxID=1403819 RepID=UPI00068D5EE4|nr:transglutaminase family protein [Verrucomicrobium sp. BvORR106]